MAENLFDPIRTITSGIVVLPQENIDTDQILPARFMTTTTRAGLGHAAFYDWRRDALGEIDPTNVLNRIDPARNRILVAGRNFGSGSSREHAPWALIDYGFRVILSSEIADIFTANALGNGLLAIVVDKAIHLRLLEASGRTMTVDLENQKMMLHDGEVVEFAINPFDRKCLMEGNDALAWLMSFENQINIFEARLPR